MSPECSAPACQPVERKRNAGARNVAGLAQRSNHALVWHAEALDRLTQDSFVSLMEYKMIDVFDRNARIARKLMDRVADGVDAELEHAAAIHGQHARASAEAYTARCPPDRGRATSRRRAPSKAQRQGDSLPRPPSLRRPRHRQRARTWHGRSSRARASSARRQRPARARRDRGRYSPRRHRAQIRSRHKPPKRRRQGMSRPGAQQRRTPRRGRGGRPSSLSRR